jgi:hypothetical protein
MPPVKAAKAEAEDLSDLIKAGADPEDAYEDDEPATQEEPEQAEQEESEQEAAASEDVEGLAPATEPDEEAKSGVKPDTKPATDEPFIPKSRFDEVNERRKAAEQRLRDLEAKEKAADPAQAVNFDFQGKEKLYMEAVLDGDTDKALVLREEIRAAEQALFQAMTEKAGQTARTAAKQDIKLEQTIAELTAKYVEFDPDAENYSDDLSREALSLQRTFISEGYDPDKALRKAVNYVAKVYDLRAADEEAPKQGLQAASVEKTAPKPTSAQVESKMRTAGQQPPLNPTAGKDAPRSTDIMNMTDEEFEKLSASDIRKLRGDFRPGE